MRTFNWFISHPWQYSDQYKRLRRLLRRPRNFAFKDYSMPKDDPVHDGANDAQLRRATREQKKPCHVVLILAGIYAGCSKWINIETQVAKNGFQGPKSVVAIRHCGSVRIYGAVRDTADEITNSSTDSIAGLFVGSRDFSYLTTLLAKVKPRRLAGKPLPRFRATRERRISVLCGIVSDGIRQGNRNAIEIRRSKIDDPDSIGFPARFLEGRQRSSMMQAARHGVTRVHGPETINCPNLNTRNEVQ